VVELRDLQYLTALVRHKHFARAAQECGVSQPAFSMRIRNLEERLKATIVKRGNRFQGLTTEGEKIVARARTIVDQVQALEQEVNASRGDIFGQLTLGAIPTAACYAGLLAIQLKKAHPRIVVRIKTTNSLAIQQGVDDGAFHAGITYTEGVSTDLLQADWLYDEQYVLLLPARFAPKRAGEIAWREAAAFPLTLLEPQMQNRRILDRIFEDLDVEPTVAFETDGFSAALVTALEGAAATVVPRVLIDSLGGVEGASVLPLIDPTVEKSVSLVTPLKPRTMPIVAALRRVALTVQR